MIVSMGCWTTFQLEKYLKDGNRSALFLNESKFVRGFDGVDLSPGARRMLTVPNAGGSSLWSEVMSFEVLKRTLKASLLKTEMELKYVFENSKITDYSVTVFGLTIGVSVTRALKFRGKFTLADAESLLTKKLNGVVHSTRNSVDPFHKQILHVWAKDRNVGRLLRAAYRKMDNDELKSNTVVVVTVVENADWIFFEPCKKKVAV